eukprot:scaffold127602_cov60-Cyclotella_meneghiniana.AAC.2
MTIINEITDRGAVVAWSPIAQYADVIALGSKEKAGNGFDDYGGSLELYNVLHSQHDSNNNSPQLLCTIPTTTRFGSLAWGRRHADNGGMLAGGMMDGTVQLWRSDKLLTNNNNDGAGGDAVEIKMEDNSVVSALKFCPHKDNGGVLLASGSASGQIRIIDLSTPTSPSMTSLSTNPPTNSTITSLAWNTQVSHILSSSSTNGQVTVWDLRQKKPWSEVRVDGNSAVNDVVWNPTQGLHMMTAGEHSGLQLWDLRASTSMPLTTLETGGVLSCDWCPFDDTLLLSCGTDNKTKLWDLYTLKVVAEIPNDNNNSYGSGSSGELQNSGLGGTHSGSNNELFDPQDCIAHCRDMAENSKEEYEMHVWNFMQIMFEANAREELLGYLGFDPERIHQHAMEFESKEDEDDQRDGYPQMSIEAENAVKDALLVGNFEAAVECCFRSNNLADALVLASCGGADLWAKTQAEYFAREAKKRPFLSLVSAVIHDQLTDLVALSDPRKWKETLAVLSTYGKSDEFPNLCEALGERLEEAGDMANASLCYMCALNLTQTVKYWKHTLQNANASFEGTDLLSVHEFIEKVAVFTQAMDSSSEMDDETANLFAEYSSALANQGLFVAAAKYLKGNTQECKELRDRIYRSRMGQFCPELIASPPEFPYDFVNVGVARDLYGITVKQNAVDMAQQQAPVVQQQPSNVNATQQTQQSYQQQQVVHQEQPVMQQQMHQEQVQPPENNAVPSLPPGWVALQDPSSGMTYYANQSTGESSWEPPQPVAATQPSPTPMNGHPQMNTAQENINGTSSAASLKTQKVANKYGDGFVTSASNPKLAEQYGNVGTSNPYSDANRPGTAAAAVGNTPRKAPVSGSLDPNAVASLSGEQKFVTDGLLSIAETLTSIASSPMEKKQATEAQKGVAVFIKSSARGAVDADVASKMQTMLSALQNRDYNAAQSIMTSLVTHEWKEHRDWLKGMKILVQVASKKQI